MSSTTTTAFRSRPWRWRLALGAVVLVALALRAWMGTVDLHAGRFWDERYALENVAEVLEEGRLTPANAFHPTLAHLPQTAVLGATRSLCAHTALCSDPIVVNGRFTPLAYLLSRWLQALFGALSLLALYRVGRRLFGRAEGVTAAALLAMVPWHVRQSVIAKPDIVMLLLLVVALEAALWVAERPTLRRHALAGLATGLAGAAKYNGLTAGLLLVPGTVADLRRRPRRLLGLAAAAGVAAAVFLALNPHLVTAPEMLARDFGRTLEDYEQKGAAAGTSGMALLAHAVTTLVSDPFHGPWVGWWALAALVLLLASLGRADLGRAEREGRLALVAFPVLYAVLYALATTNPSAHNWLPLTPFTALAAAWLGVAAWRRLATRLPRRARTPVGVMAVLALVAVSAGSSTRYAYRATVPTTFTLAERRVIQGLPGDLRNRTVLYEAWEDQRLVVKRSRRNKATEVPVGELAAPVREALPGFDAAVLRRDATAVPDLAAPPPGGRTVRLDPGFLTAWGPPLDVVLRPWRSAGAGVLLDGTDGAFPVDAPELPPGARLSFVVHTAPGHDPVHLTPARFAGEEIGLYWNRYAGGGHRFVSQRVAVPEGAGPWTLELGRADPAVVRDVTLLAWLPPEG